VKKTIKRFKKTKTKAGGLAMKTKDNVQKAILKSMAVVFSIILINMTVNAQDFWKSILENASFNEIALAMTESNVEASSASTDANAFAAYLEVETEEALELEDWMVTESNFATFISIEEESENRMELEDWMTNESFFNTNSMYLEVEAEEALELENWMMEDSNFGNSAFQIIEETETELELEDWMLNNDLFNTNECLEQSLELEEWMTSAEIWID